MVKSSERRLVAEPIEMTTTASQLKTLNQAGPRRTIISLCLAGILVGGVVGELLRESMTTALHQHTLFSQLLNSPEVKDAIAPKGSPQSAAIDEMLPVQGSMAKDVYWQDGRVYYFVLGDSSFLFDNDRGPVWGFPLLLLCPIFGMLIPWGIMTLLGKMGVEYFAKKPAQSPQLPQ